MPKGTSQPEFVTFDQMQNRNEGRVTVCSGPIGPIHHTGSDRAEATFRAWRMRVYTGTMTFADDPEGWPIAGISIDPDARSLAPIGE